MPLDLTTENSTADSNDFTPFVDTNEPRINQAIIANNNNKQGIDTRKYDAFRQGVSIRIDKHRFVSTQPKIWAGNLNHAVTIRTLGQSRSFTEFENSTIFEEKPRFDPVQYIKDPNYPFPVTFNNGPQEQEEASIEPLTIKFRKNDNEGKNPTKAIKGHLEDGNYFENDDGSANRIEQFIELTPPTKPRFFLDEGVEYFGPSIPTAKLLTNSNDPIALYRLDGEIEDISGNFYDLALASGIMQWGPGPVEGTLALIFTDTTAFSSSTVPEISELHLTGAVTLQAVIKPYPSTGGDPRHIATMHGVFGSAPGVPEENNILYSLANNSSGDPKNLSFLHQSGSVSGSTNILSGEASDVLSLGEWMHVALVRDGINSSKVYVDGQLVLTSYVPYPTVGTNPSVAKLILGSLLQSGSFSSSNSFSGSISSVKINDFGLSSAEVFNEYATVFPYRAGLVAKAYQNSIIIDGYSALIQRDMSPFNETKDESIVDRINTTNIEFISALKALKFDLDEDIRGSFDKKSARAGNTVYGPGAAIVGTDSIAYIGTSRGS